MRLPPPGTKVPEAIILASDSGLTRGPLPPVDYRTKLFKLTGNAAVVYGGDSKADENCLDVLTWRLSRKNASKSVHSVYLAQKTFKAVYKQWLASRRIQGKHDAPLYILIGAFPT